MASKQIRFFRSETSATGKQLNILYRKNKLRTAVACEIDGWVEGRLIKNRLILHIYYFQAYLHIISSNAMDLHTILKALHFLKLKQLLGIIDPWRWICYSLRKQQQQPTLTKLAVNLGHTQQFQMKLTTKQKYVNT